MNKARRPARPIATDWNRRNAPPLPPIPWRALLLLLLLCLVLRWFCFLHTHIINPDGTLYIDQAKLLYYGQFADLTTPNMPYLSSYPFAIAAAHTFFNDWEAAARAVSILFGTLTALPLFFLMRRFLSTAGAVAALLMFVVTPTFVDNSIEVVRDPMGWFFAATGLYLFILQTEREEVWPAFVSGVSFLLAGWSRVEMSLYIGVAALYVLIFEPHRRLWKCTVLCLPFGLAAGGSLLSAHLMRTAELNTFRMDEVTAKSGDPLAGYHHIRAGLKQLADNQLFGPLRFFLSIVRGHIWLIAGGELVSTLVKAAHYPFAPLYLLPLGSLRERLRDKRPLIFLAAASIAALVILYVHILQTWVSEARFFPLFLLPSFVFLGMGLQMCLGFLSNRLHLKDGTALLLVGCLILAFTLPKDFKVREKDKLVYKEIGAEIARRENPMAFTRVAASDQILRWISFYANPTYPGPTCLNTQTLTESLVGDSYNRFVHHLRANRVKYFLWEEKHWPTGTYDFLQSVDPHDFRPLGRYYHPDTGTMVLFQVLQ